MRLRAQNDGYRSTQGPTQDRRLRLSSAPDPMESISRRVNQTHQRQHTAQVFVPAASLSLR